MEFFKRACKETGLAALSAAIYFLFAAALFAVFVRAFAPTATTVTIVNQIIKSIGIFLFSLLFIRRERALIKGAISGVAALLLGTLIFGCIGGFRWTAFYLIEILLAAFFGGLGALCGVKLRKE